MKSENRLKLISTLRDAIGLLLIAPLIVSVVWMFVSLSYRFFIEGYWTLAILFGSIIPFLIGLYVLCNDEDEKEKKQNS